MEHGDADGAVRVRLSVVVVMDLEAEGKDKKERGRQEGKSGEFPDPHGYHFLDRVALSRAST